MIKRRRRNEKVTRRAISALIVAAFVITGVFFYCFRYVENGATWASFFSVSNVTGTSTIMDRNGVLLASETSGAATYAKDRTTGSPAIRRWETSAATSVQGR